ncbi:unnamed protein product [Cuscuta epithymum]|uniref:DUF4216 domain-containing protein n=1 Tax=Cuscuta epithymum TaxID=186058 RepID=A0AAV0F4E9_9ASTE|nr:unnamed protein product [Cuscuta epithymum]
MYSAERYMKILKGYVKNQYRPEASIVERYVAEEAIEFCTNYISEVEAIGLPKSRHDGRCKGQGTRGLRCKSMSRDDVFQAHLYILNNSEEVQPYLQVHKALVKQKNPRKTEKWLLNEHNKTFVKWFQEQILKDTNASERLRWFANGIHFEVMCWGGYDINRYSFCTKFQDDKSSMQNSGVMVVAEAMHFSSAKDKNPVMASVSYYGIIDEIWEIDYTGFREVVFKCKWVDNRSGVKIDELGVTLVNLDTLAYTSEPFIMAYQAKQVFYVTDPSNMRWSVVLQGKHLSVNDENSDDILEIPLSASVATVVADDDELDNVHAVREDHEEGIWENIPVEEDE